MIFLEDSARFLLVIHAILGAALVGATTHVAWSLRRYSRGEFDRHHQVRRLAWIGFGLFLAAFVTGNLLYPTYKIRVRGEILDSGDAIAALHRDRIEALAASEDAAQRAYAMAGIGPEQVGVVGQHCAFGPQGLITLAMFGLAKPGHAQDLVYEGTIMDGGKVAVPPRGRLA